MKNMGEYDRAIRIVVAVAVTVLFMNRSISGWLGLTLVIVAFIFLFTGIIGFCPLYFPFGVNTRRKKAID